MTPDCKNGLLTENAVPLAKHQPPIHTKAIAELYKVEEQPFARGKFAIVKRCTAANLTNDNKEDGREFAAKFVKRRQRCSDEEILHEIRVLRLAAKCERIVQLLDVFETPRHYVMVLEKLAGGELQRVLDEEEFLPERMATRFLRQVLEAICFLHEHQIVHLDIKPQNILLTKKYPDCDVKLCDFGISRVVSKGYELREIVGTPDYVAPEILHYEPITLATDIW